MKKTEKYRMDLLCELDARVCIERDGGTAPEALFCLVSSLVEDGGSDTAFSAVSARDLREDAVVPAAGQSLLTGITEDGFAVTRFKLTSDTAE